MTAIPCPSSSFLLKALLVVGVSLQAGCPANKVQDPLPTPGAGLFCNGLNIPDADARAADGTPYSQVAKDAFEEHLPSLKDALANEDADQISAAVCVLREALGEWQGVAEAAGNYQDSQAVFPDKQTILSGVFANVQDSLFDTEFEQWRLGSVFGADASQPLRVSCEVMRGYLALSSVLEANQADVLKQRAQAAADWLLLVQAENGVFPFPDLSNKAEALLLECTAQGESRERCEELLPRPYQLSLTGHAAWISAGQPADALVNGWFVDVDFVDPGGLQFDNGICGRAMLAAYDVFDDERYLNAAGRAGDWAKTQPVVANWNYNAFSVGLLAQLSSYRSSDDVEAAWQKARLGVLPGGMENGRWFDAHNARIVYHEIILLNLAMLDRVLDEEWLDKTLEAALKRSQVEITTRGAVALDDAIEAHLLLSQMGLDESDALALLVDAGFSGTIPTTLGVLHWLAEK